MMTEQKPFYEIPKPSKKTYTIVVEEALPESAPLQCQFVEPIFNKAGEAIGSFSCETDTMSYDVYECDCCGGQFCGDHMKRDFCFICDKLSSYDIKKIRAFRLELNS